MRQSWIGERGSRAASPTRGLVCSRRPLSVEPRLPNPRGSGVEGSSPKLGCGIRGSANVDREPHHRQRALVCSRRPLSVEPRLPNPRGSGVEVSSPKLGCGIRGSASPTRGLVCSRRPLSVELDSQTHVGQASKFQVRNSDAANVDRRTWTVSADLSLSVPHITATPVRAIGLRDAPRVFDSSSSMHGLAYLLCQESSQEISTRYRLGLTQFACDSRGRARIAS
jgi:hypothetical protein